jgi:glycosyltransferase involved in cell wall biosynthesis
LKKVLYISPNGYLGGAERFVLTAVNAHASGNKIAASILFFSGGEAYQEAKNAGLDCYMLKHSFRYRFPWKLFLALKEIRQIVKEVRPDILHLTMPYSHISLSLATIGLSIKKVWFQHGPVGSHLDRLANFFPVDVILYNSLDVKNRHRKTWPPPLFVGRELIINPGIKLSQKNHTLFNNKTLALASAGRICSWKGFHNIVKAIGELKQEINVKPFKLKIAGSVKMNSDKQYKDELIKLCQTYNLVNEVEFLDHVNDMEEFYQEQDVFIHASLIPEPFGLVVAESMTNGCLVIASDNGGVKDLVQNGVTGFNFPATSHYAVSELKKVLNLILVIQENFPKEKYQNIAEAGKFFIQKNFSIEAMNSKLEDLYLSMEK